MANRWGIPKEVEEHVKARDLCCVYCGTPFNHASPSRRTRPTWEHIINDVRINGPENIALCCGSCNASKGSKLLLDWLDSKYCRLKEITKESVALVVKNHFKTVSILASGIWPLKSNLLEVSLSPPSQFHYPCKRDSANV